MVYSPLVLTCIKCSKTWFYYSNVVVTKKKLQKITVKSLYFIMQNVIHDSFQGFIYLIQNTTKTVILCYIFTILNNCFLFEYILKCNLFLWSKLNFQHHYSSSVLFSVTWSFRNAFHCNCTFHTIFIYFFIAGLF